MKDSLAIIVLDARRGQAYLHSGFGEALQAATGSRIISRRDVFERAALLRAFLRATAGRLPASEAEFQRFIEVISRYRGPMTYYEELEAAGILPP